MAQEDFYEKLDLRYPEIAICLEKIDRVNPGKKKFMIPVLTPDLDPKDISIKESKIQQSSSFIENQTAVKVSPVTVRNYIEIVIPREMCAYHGQYYDITEGAGEISQDMKGDIQLSLEGDMSMKLSGTLDSSDLSGNFSESGEGSITGSLSGSGTVGPPTGYNNLSVTGSASGTLSESGTISEQVTGSMSTSLSGTAEGSLHGTESEQISGTHKYKARERQTPVDRYIEKGSKWIVVFIGGDITKPQIIGRYTDDDYVGAPS